MIAEACLYLPRAERARALLLAAISSLFFTSSASASRGPAESAYSSDDCPQVFGDAEAESENQEHRERVFVELKRWSRRSVPELLLQHRASYTTPKRLRSTELDLVAVQRDEDQAYGLLEVSPKVVPSSCPSGIYRIEVDDSLGTRAHVLAINEGVVLLDWQGELVYLSSSATRPRWRMVWESPFTVPRPPLPVAKSTNKRRGSRRSRRNARNRRNRRR